MVLGDCFPRVFLRDCFPRFFARLFPKVFLRDCFPRVVGKIVFPGGGGFSQEVRGLSPRIGGDFSAKFSGNFL